LKKIIVIIVVLVLISSFSFAAVQIGDAIGDVLYTDIVTKINGVNINSFNINGSTAIYVSELKKLGYDVKWDGNKRQVEVIDNREQEIISSETKDVKGYQPENQGLTVGSAIGKVLHTDIETYLEGSKVDSFNINGSTAIYVDALSTSGIDYEWDGENRQVLIKRGPRKVLRELDEYTMVKVNYLGNNEYQLDIDSIPQPIIDSNYRFYQSGSNAFTKDVSDSEIIELLASYEDPYVSDQKRTIKDSYLKFDDSEYGEITYFSFVDKDGDLLAIIPIEYGLPKTDFETRIIETKNYDYDQIIQEKINYIENKLENSVELTDDEVDLVQLPESEANWKDNAYRAYLNENLDEKYQEAFFYKRAASFSNASNKTRNRLIDHLDQRYIDDDEENQRPAYAKNGLNFELNNENGNAILYFHSIINDQILYYRVDSDKVKNEVLEDEYILYEIVYDEGALALDGLNYLNTNLINKNPAYSFEDFPIGHISSEEEGKIIVGPFKSDTQLEKEDFVNGKYILSIEAKDY